MPLQKIKFQTNITVEMALKFTEGKLCDSQFGDPQYMFTTIDDRVFFVAEKVAQKIHGLHLQPREPFDMTKAEVDYGNGRKGIEWRVAKVCFVPGEQPDGTFAIPAPPAPLRIRPDNVEAELRRSIEQIKEQQRANQAGTSVLAPAPVAAAPVPPAQPYNNGNGTSNGNGKLPSSDPADPLVPWAQFLLAQVNAVVDVYALACRHASEQHGNLVRAEDVRALLTTTFINYTQKGGRVDVA